MRSTLRTVVPFLLGLTGPLAAQQTATTVLTSARDATIYSEGPLANGSGLSCFFGKTVAGNFRRGLVQFDTSAIPAGATVVSARLDLDIDRFASGTPTPNALHRLTADWVEGPSVAIGDGAMAGPGDVTWTDRSFGATAWSTPGGDFVATASETLTISGSNASFGTTGALDADVQGWITNPGSNFGWILIGDERASAFRTAGSFVSREGGMNAPSLTVTWTIPASVTSTGTGCSVGGAPAYTLAATGGLPSLGNAGFGLALSGGSLLFSSPTILFGTALLPAPFPLFGCPLWVDPSTVFASGPAVGGGGLNLPISLDPVQLGWNIVLQGAAIDVTAGALATTNALTLVIGG